MEYVKQPCKHCPFRDDITPFLHPSRAAEIAYAAGNPYSEFPCHKTTVADEDSDFGEMMQVSTSKECAGFLTMRANMGLKTPEGFVPAIEICYQDPEDMIDANEQEWEGKRYKR